MADYQIVDAASKVLTQAVGIDGLFAHPGAPLTVVGCEPFDLPSNGKISLRALDDTGRRIRDIELDTKIIESRPSALGKGLVDVVLAHTRPNERPPPEVRAVWEEWQRGVPAEPVQWAKFDTRSREEWMSLALGNTPAETPLEPGFYHLDGTHVTDVPGLHLAMGEAVVGPGQSYGAGYESLRELLSGEWGPEIEDVTIVWHNARVAHDAIPDYFIDIVRMLRHHGVTIEFDSTLDLVTALDERTELGEVVERWYHGWLKADGLSPAAEDDLWLCALVNRPGRKFEWVAKDEHDARSLSRMVARHADPGWLSVPTHAAADVTRMAEEAGLTLRPPETFMRRTLPDHPLFPEPDGYTTAVTRDDVIKVQVLHNGVEAASGLVAVVGDDAVPNAVKTSPDHRRRGLGSVVMGLLAREAVVAGATTGLLFASEDGLHLYRRLGWETISDVVIAHKP